MHQPRFPTDLILVVAGVLGALYIAERAAHDRTWQEVSTSKTQLEGVRKKLDSTKGKLTAAEQARTEQESRAAELQKCADAPRAGSSALRTHGESNPSPATGLRG